MAYNLGYTRETAEWNEITEFIRSLPGEKSYVLPGLAWGNYAQLYTPAFWKFQYQITHSKFLNNTHRLSDNLIEEVVMCILGGYGIPSEMGIMAFGNLKKRGLISRNVTFEQIYTVLASPMDAGSGRLVKYRFYNQKSKYIASFLNRSDLDYIPQHNDFQLRKWLLSIDGIGLKTASWITRNWLNSDNVAIIDVHLLRAGQLTGFFKPDTSDYLELEQQFLKFCSAIDVNPSNMDAIIWGYMKKNAKLALKSLTPSS